MEFVSARDLRLNPKKVWKRLRNRSMGVVTINGQPSFLLTKLNPDQLEAIILIQNRIRAELALLELQEQAAEGGSNKLTPEEIDGIIAQTRKTRHKK